jgi:hypothetical protein
MTTNTKLLQAAFSAAIVSTSLLTGCGPELGAVDTVDVPEVRASVAIDELCELANELRCAGAMGCCEADAPYGSAEECLAASTSCESLIAEVTGSELFVDGTISYDAELAASVLQAAADSTAGCGTEAPMPELNSLFTGSLGEGEDCTPRDNSGAHMLACAPGLACVVDEDIEGVEGVFGSCEHLDVQPVAADDDSDSDADSMTGGDLYCAAPEQPSPPSNATVPVGLSINVWNDSGAAGTNNTVYLHFINKNTTTEYYCTIAGGLDPNETKVCTNIQTRTYNGTPSNNLFWVETNGNDGLKVDSFAVCTSLKNNNTQCNGTAFTTGTFDNGDTSMLSSVKIWAFGMFDDGYDAFWVDGSGNGSCSGAKINLGDDNTVTCGTHTIGNH